MDSDGIRFGIFVFVAICFLTILRLLGLPRQVRKLRRDHDELAKTVATRRELVALMRNNVTTIIQQSQPSRREKRAEAQPEEPNLAKYTVRFEVTYEGSLKDCTEASEAVLEELENQSFDIEKAVLVTADNKEIDLQ